jgi:hypothetical protein
MASQRESAMSSFDIKTASQALSPAEFVPYNGDPLTYETATWGERVVTVAATIAAVLVVATIAVLMSMA